MITQLNCYSSLLNHLLDHSVDDFFRLPSLGLPEQANAETVLQIRQDHADEPVQIVLPDSPRCVDMTVQEYGQMRMLAGPFKDGMKRCLNGWSCGWLHLRRLNLIFVGEHCHLDTISSVHPTYVGNPLFITSGKGGVVPFRWGTLRCRKMHDLSSQ